MNSEEYVQELMLQLKYLYSNVDFKCVDQYGVYCIVGNNEELIDSNAFLEWESNVWSDFVSYFPCEGLYFKYEQF